MKLNKSKFIFFLFLLFYSIETIALENKILFKVNNEIISTVDLYNEIKYLKLINPNLKNLEKEKIYEISKNSLIREKIKEIELSKNYEKLNLNDEYLNKLIKNYIKRIGFSSLIEFEKYVFDNDLDIEAIKNKIKHEILWNQLIVRKFLKDVKINKKQIKEDLKKNNKQIEYFLSEIIFNVENKNDLEKKINLIKKDIKLKGFASAASIHGISDTSNAGGKLGWIKSSSLNKKIQSEISKINVGNYTKPIIVPGGFLILKIDDKRLTNNEINFEQEVKLVVDAKTNEQLNRLSITYFNKIKRDIQIDEL